MELFRTDIHKSFKSEGLEAPSIILHASGIAQKHQERAGWSTAGRAISGDYENYKQQAACSSDQVASSSSSSKSTIRMKKTSSAAIAEKEIKNHSHHDNGSVNKITRHGVTTTRSSFARH
jgi:hypothetical protein